MADDEVFPSLEELCYLSLIDRAAHQYPSDYLALLPTSLRRRLLSLLPAADIHSLEIASSPALSDVDTDQLWMELYSSFYGDTYDMLKSDVPRVPHYGKTTILNKAVDQVLYPFNYSVDSSEPLWSSTCANKNSHIGGVIDTLICIPSVGEHVFSARYTSLLDCYNLVVLCSDCQRLYPGHLRLDRSLSPFCVYRDQALSVCELLVDVFCRFPETLFHYYHSKNIVNLALENAKVRDFVAGTEKLKLCCYQHHTEYDKSSREKRMSEHNPQEILKLIISSPHPKLSSLSIVGVDASFMVIEKFRDFANIQVELVTPFFAPGFPEKLVGTSPNDYAPFSMLESLSVTGLVIDENILEHLTAVIRHQVCLNDITIKCTSGEPAPILDELLSALMDTVRRPHFRSLVLHSKDQLELSVASFVRLFVSFLSSPASHSQTLDLKSVCVKEELQSANMQSEIESISFSNVCQQKELSLECVSICKDAMRCLSLLPPYSLQKLTIVNSFAIYDQLQLWQNVFNVTASEVAVTLSGQPSTVPEYPLFGYVLKNWLASSSIEKLHLCGVSILLSPSHLFSFTEALSKHSQTSPTLTELSIKNCFLGVKFPADALISPAIPLVSYQGVSQFSSELTMFFMAILQLVQYNNQLQLIIEDRTLHSGHFLLLHSIWETVCKSGKHRLKLLRVKQPIAVNPNDKAGFRTKMEEIAVKFSAQMLKPIPLL